jgi:tetratricopeptide (TPR) repeat protein
MKILIILISLLLSIGIYTEDVIKGITLPFPSSTEEIEEIEEIEVIEYAPQDSQEEKKFSEIEEKSTEKSENSSETIVDHDKLESDSKISESELTQPVNKKIIRRKVKKKIPKKIVAKEVVPPASKNLSIEENKIARIEKSPLVVQSPSSTNPIPSNLEEPKNSLPNLQKKKGKDSKDATVDMGPYVRGNYHLNRSDSITAASDYNIATSNEGYQSNLSKLELIRLLAKDRKVQQAKNLIEGLEDLDLKFKGYFELASGLENSAKSKKEKEESLNIYLYILTEVPRENPKNPGEPNPMIAKASYAIGLLLYKLEDYTPALDHLSTIILKHKNSEYIDAAIYLSGKIYEEGTSGKVRNLERAIKFYKMFLDKKDTLPFKKSIYLKDVEKRYKNLVNQK